MKKLSLVFTALSLTLAANHVVAGATAEQVAALGGDKFTPVGAEKGANADGSIPAWTGGITEVPAGYEVGMHHINPFSSDKVLFTIDSSNYKQYAANLSLGQQKMFETYPDTFKMNVYQTRRSASYPDKVYEATKKYAESASLVEGGNGITGVAIGVPFPFPASGLEVIWNHITRYRGEKVARYGGQAAPTAGGDYTFVGFDDRLIIKYAEDDATPEKLENTNIVFKFKQKVVEPARLSGTALLVHETMDQIKTPRQAWTYNTGQRRVRRAPNVAYDSPGTASDGLRTTDDFDMYNGAPNRYNWELKGKQEMYIAYNDYNLHSDKLKLSDIVHAGHINPEHVRYEKHRVWVVEATLKEGTRHTYKKRVFYIDEDSWQVQVSDIYDNRDELYRVAVAHGLNYYEVPTGWSTLEVFHDLNARRYIAIGLDNQQKMYDFNPKINDKQFTPAALRREGIR